MLLLTQQAEALKRYSNKSLIFASRELVWYDLPMPGEKPIIPSQESPPKNEVGWEKKKTPEDQKKESRDRVIASQESVEAKKKNLARVRAETPEKIDQIRQAGEDMACDDPDSAECINHDTETKIQELQEQSLNTSKTYISESDKALQLKKWEIRATESLESLDPDEKKAAHTAIVRQSITLDSLSDATKKTAVEEVKKMRSDFDTLPKEEQDRLILLESTKPEKVQKAIEAYELAKAEALKKDPTKPLTVEQLDEIMKTNLWLQSLTEQQRLSMSLDILKKDKQDMLLNGETSFDIVDRVLSENTLIDIVQTLWTDMEWENIPDILKQQLTANPRFAQGIDVDIPLLIRDQIQLAKDVMIQGAKTWEDPKKFEERFQSSTGFRAADRWAVLQRASQASPGDGSQFLKTLALFFAHLFPNDPKSRAFLAKYGWTDSGWGKFTSEYARHYWVPDWVSDASTESISENGSNKITQLALQWASEWKAGIKGAVHCTDWVDKVYKQTTGNSVYNFKPDYNGVHKVSGWGSSTGIWWTHAPKEKIAQIGPWQHLIVDHGNNGGRTHSVIALGTPDSAWRVQVVSYPNGGKPPRVEWYNLWEGAGQKRVLRIQWPKLAPSAPKTAPVLAWGTTGPAPTVTEASVYDAHSDGKPLPDSAMGGSLHYSDNPEEPTSCAADWSLYPPGTVMRINGKRYVVEDYGSYIMKPWLRTRIDRYQPNYAQTLAWKEHLLKSPQVVIEKMGNFQKAESLLASRAGKWYDHVDFMLQEIRKRWSQPSSVPPLAQNDTPSIPWVLPTLPKQEWKSSETSLDGQRVEFTGEVSFSSVKEKESDVIANLTKNLPQYLKTYASDFYQAGRENWLSPYLLAAISIQETHIGWWRMSEKWQQGNLMGISDVFNALSFKNIQPIPVTDIETQKYNEYRKADDSRNDNEIARLDKDPVIQKLKASPWKRLTLYSDLMNRLVGSDAPKVEKANGIYLQAYKMAHMKNDDGHTFRYAQANTVELMGKIYCPTGATNDRGQNGTWPSGVRSKLVQLQS